MNRSACSVIDLAAYRRERARERRRQRLYVLLALLPQRLALAALLGYAVLRPLLAPDVPFTYYSGPLSALWPLAFLLLLTSYVSDCLLWRDAWAQ